MMEFTMNFIHLASLKKKEKVCYSAIEMKNKKHSLTKKETIKCAHNSNVFIKHSDLETHVSTTRSFQFTRGKAKRDNKEYITFTFL